MHSLPVAPADSEAILRIETSDCQRAADRPGARVRRLAAWRPFSPRSASLPTITGRSGTIEIPFHFDAFLSHSAKDKAIVRPLAERLRADGLKVWFDEWEIQPGDSIPAEIEEGRERLRGLVL